MSTGPEPDESGVFQLKHLPTLKELYKSSVLKAPLADNIRHKPNAALLDKIALFKGDITSLKVDAIVNAANKSLLGGGGVDGTIHRAAGKHLLEECRGLNGCNTGESKITRGYNLPARHVIHTVGPVYNSDDAEAKAKQLASCYKTSLEVAVENYARHVAFPCVSTGIYGYPIVDATRIALEEVRRFCESEEGGKLERVIFVIWTDKDEKVYRAIIPEYFPPVELAEQKEPVDPEPEPNPESEPGHTKDS